jgi:hypothetical protein
MDGHSSGPTPSTLHVASGTPPAAFEAYGAVKDELAARRGKPMIAITAVSD